MNVSPNLLQNLNKLIFTAFIIPNILLCQGEVVDLELAYLDDSEEMMMEFFKEGEIRKEKLVNGVIGIESSLEAYLVFVRGEKRDRTKYWIVDTTEIELIIVDSIYTKREKDSIIYRKIGLLETNEEDLKIVSRDYEEDSILSHIHTYRYWKVASEVIEILKVPMIEYISKLEGYIPIIISEEKKEQLRRFLWVSDLTKTKDYRYSKIGIENYLSRIRFLQKYIEIKSEGIGESNLYFRCYPLINRILVDERESRIQFDFERMWSSGEVTFEKNAGKWEIIELEIILQE